MDLLPIILFLFFCFFLIPILCPFCFPKYLPPPISPVFLLQLLFHVFPSFLLYFFFSYNSLFFLHLQFPLSFLLFFIIPFISLFLSFNIPLSFPLPIYNSLSLLLFYSTSPPSILFSFIWRFFFFLLETELFRFPIFSITFHHLSLHLCFNHI